MNPISPVAGEPKSHRIVSRLFLAAALLINLWLATRHWNESLRDGHEFRQIQTAITAYFAREDGFKFAYETPVLGPPWSVPMEFPLYQWLVAGLSKATGLHLEQAGRLVSLLSFYAALPAIWLLLARWGFSPTTRRFALASVLVCPLLTFYSRTFLIEGTALALSLWFLWSFWRAVEDRSVPLLALAWVLGGLAAVTKVTTFAVFCVPAGLVTLAATCEWRSNRPGIRSWRSGMIAAAGLVVPIGAAIAWVRYSDQVKSLNPYGSFLTSATLHDWNWGTLAQRFTLEFWSAIYRVTSTGILSEPALLLLLGALPGLAAPARWRTLACIALSFVGCLLFANLYFVHDYYSYATAGFLAVALGITAGSLLEDGRFPARLVGTLFALALATQVMIFWRGYGNFYKRPNEAAPPFSEIIRRTTAPADMLIAFGLDWNGVIPYHAGRRALMVPHHKLDDREAFKKSVAGFGDLRVGSLIIAGTLRSSPEFVIPRLRQFGMEAFPIASTTDMDLYLRSDLHERARSDLRGNQYPGVVFQLELQPARLDETTENSLTTPEWAGKFIMCSPAPRAYRSPFRPVIDLLDNAIVIRTHAPMEYLFNAPPGATRIEAVGAMVPDAYTNGNVTDGVILQLFEEFSNGRRVLLTERELKPLNEPADRGDVTLSHVSTQPYRGTLVLRVDPGQMGVINCDWGYWRSVKIH
jgi:4-amino-4-deoxy-L-arabinose transferase-like glycosyltransferase